MTTLSTFQQSSKVSEAQQIFRQQPINYHLHVADHLIIQCTSRLDLPSIDGSQKAHKFSMLESASW